MKAFHPGIFIVSFGTSFSALAPVSRLKCTSPFKLILPKSICLRQSVPHDRRHRRFHFRFHRFHFHNLVFVSFLKLVEFAIPKGLEALNRCHSIYDIHWFDLACAMTSNPSCLESTTSDEVKISPFAMLTNFSVATVDANGFLIHSITVPYTVEWTTCLMDWKVSSLEYLVNLRCRVGKVAHFVQVDWKRYEMYLLCPDDTVYGNNISCGIHIASVLGFGVKVEIIQGSLKELSGDVMCWNDYVINRILNYFHVGNKIYETSIHSIGFGVKVEIIQSSLKELSGDDMCWNDYVSIM
ncbi:hypothetical protein GQR58_016405 [Nymphon striatum]|nr:hypothetical protein GQR58_016405 [Nymphon striatum]